ncbi:unnamed protein product, partial [Prorocentrum cordatum]
ADIRRRAFVGKIAPQRSRHSPGDWIFVPSRLTVAVPGKVRPRPQTAKCPPSSFSLDGARMSGSLPAPLPPAEVAAPEAVGLPAWLRGPVEAVDREEYHRFYRANFRLFDAPLATIHFKIAGEVAGEMLLFIPGILPYELAQNSEDMFSGCRGVRVYQQGAFLQGKLHRKRGRRLVPFWLVFVRGVADLRGVPLDAGFWRGQMPRTIREHLVREVLRSIGGLCDNARDQFWSIYGKYIKVGLAADPEYRGELKRLVRFHSSTPGGSTTSLPEYLDRMKEKEGQDNIFFVTGEGKQAAELAPAMEGMKRKGYEVLYMIDLLDEICCWSIVDFDGHDLVDISSTGLALGRTADESSRLEDLKQRYEGLAAWLKNQLGERVRSVEVGDRLVDSAATLVHPRSGMSPIMQRYVKSQTDSRSQDAAFAMGCRIQAIPVIDELMKRSADTNELRMIGPFWRSTRNIGQFRSCWQCGRPTHSPRRLATWRSCCGRVRPLPVATTSGTLPGLRCASPT